jgi:hypothetical protein
MVFRKSSALSVLILLTSTLLLTCKQSLSQTPADFSGNWTLNVSKSSPSPGPSPMTVLSTMIIIQKGNEITFNITIIPKDNKPITRTEKYIIGAGASTKSSNRTRTLTSAWGTDKQTFSITEIINSDESGIKKEVKRITVYSMTDQGKTLIIKVNDTLPAGSLTPENERHSISVYDKS